MSGPGVGFEYPKYSVAWLKRDLLLFAASIGVTEDELHFFYVNFRFSTPLDVSNPVIPLYVVS
jgi:hypothetical protein